MAIDLTVGIDVGMSGTAVAYRQHKIDKATCDVQCLKWGGDDSWKVPTRLAYARTGSAQSPLYWGDKIPENTENLSIKEWFKTDFGDNDSDHAAAEKLYADYLKCLHDELSERFVLDGILDKPWNHSNISFAFSVPACWDPYLVSRFKTLISRAGFEKAQSQLLGRGAHSIAVTMTEPQATAAFELHTPNPVASLQRGQNVMIVDVGAGTGDFSVLQVATNAQHTQHWREHQPVIGRKIGSSRIDQGFEVRMTDILKPHQHLLGRRAALVAWEMRCSPRFLEAKHKFGSTDKNTRRVPVPHLGDPQSIFDDYIQNGDLINPGRELAPLFDQQIEEMTDCICERIMELNEPLERLGSSPYVKRKLKERCDGHPRLKSASLVVSRKPRLAVCMGLVYNTSEKGVAFPRVACRASFGMVGRIPSAAPAKSKWRSILKRGKGVEGRYDDCVEWIIRKGEEIDNEGELEIDRTVFFKQGERKVCNIEIVTSVSDNPSSAKDRHVTHQVMRANLEGAEVKKKRKVFWSKDYFLQVNFKIRATIGMAEASFLCVDARGVKVSEPVTVRVPRDPPIMALDEVEGE
ncbi:hypothetical protein CDV31_011001 [Fusarium ambrosium]|uniref:Hsp70 family chaperone n=1 Tax=Fusarium ambrosium TaxID=131363 RepID=A0A428TJP7_9HYPO|nr:hypothetical protein CDV31_011001 [Fusarium ambrosium]